MLTASTTLLLIWPVWRKSHEAVVKQDGFSPSECCKIFLHPSAIIPASAASALHNRYSKYI